MNIFQKLQILTKSLYPTGRAFKMPYNGFFEKLNNGLIASEERAYNDFVSVLYSVLPDNANFTTDDADDWERRLGLITNPLVSLANRKAAIIRKLNFPGRNPARGHFKYIELQLQLAGFNVFVYENIPAAAPSTYGYSGTTVPVRHGKILHGQLNHGGTYYNKIVNYIDEARDSLFNLGGTFRLTFFIGGPTIGTSANVPVARKDEFRQLILKLKQTQTVGLLYINYV